MNKRLFGLLGLILGLSLAAGTGIAAATNVAYAKAPAQVLAVSKTVTMNSFSALSGFVNGDENISYEAAKGSANTAPAVNSNQIRIYQNGGLLTIAPNNSSKITSIIIGSSMATKVQVNIDNGGFGSDNSISANGTYNTGTIAAETSVVFKCTGTDKNSRLYLNYLSVTYDQDAPTQNYTVTFNAGENGNGTYEEIKPAGNYKLPAFSDLTGITPDTGYRCKEYLVGDEHKNPGDTITLDGNKTIEVVFEVAPLETTYDFVANFSTYANDWGNSYSARTLDGIDDLNGSYNATIEISYAAKQTQTITNMPVYGDEKTGDVLAITFTLNEDGYVIKNVSVEFLPWGSKTPTMKLFAGTAVSGTALDTATIGTKNEVSANNLGLTQFVVACNDGASKRNQVGIKSITILIEKSWTNNFLDTFTCTGAVEGHEDGDIAVADPETVWGELATSFAALPESTRDALKTLKVDNADSIDKQAMARYDLVIRKYTTAKYADFIGRFTATGANPAGVYSNIVSAVSSDNTLVITLLAVGSFVLAAGCLTIARKRRLH